MRYNFLFFKELRRYGPPSLCKLEVLGLRIQFESAENLTCIVADGVCKPDGGVDVLAWELVSVGGDIVERGLGGGQCFGTDLTSLPICDGVPHVAQLVVGVLADVGPDSGGLVIEDFVCAK